MIRWNSRGCSYICCPFCCWVFQLAKSKCQKCETAISNVMFVWKWIFTKTTTGWVWGGRGWTSAARGTIWSRSGCSRDLIKGSQGRHHSLIQLPYVSTLSRTFWSELSRKCIIWQRQNTGFSWSVISRRRQKFGKEEEFVPKNDFCSNMEFKQQRKCFLKLATIRL